MKLTVRDILEPFDERLGARPEPIILTLTEKKGFVSQVERFNKRLATENTSKYKVIRSNDIAFNPYLLWAGAIARNRLWGEAIISPAYPTFHVRDGFDPSFVEWVFSGEPMRLLFDAISFGSVPRRRRANIEDFLSIKLENIPSFTEQKRIATILDKTQSIRLKRQQALDLAEQLLRSTFLDMFGDPASNTKEFEVVPVKNLAKVITGNTPPRNNSEFYGSTIEWIKSSNINTSSHLLTKAKESLSEKGKSVGRWAPKNSILVTCIAGSPECIGNSAITDREVAFNQQINAMIPFDDVDPYFLYTQVLIAKRIIQVASTNSMKGMISKSSFENILLLNPPLPLQNKFGFIFKKFLSIYQNMKDSSSKADYLYSSITQCAFNGEI